ncbi:methionine ABC transporter ATP-binding protein [Psittacicella gerlachiana]|uniref:Cell division ATP-binding protein FtsE n=1 Tax=Psittacicella gerlachiana TaxID=2028574 RepID=A0A3A1Y2E9_9GAMM|nr:ATP-binding cassette domain-containing protein [Psittacicella gerlachiana]RIY31479.1 methionine ABC transporter ATP-binding protein [Psittacicella gerlachiana]
MTNIQSTPKIQLKDIEKYYYGPKKGQVYHALKNLNLTINQGQIFGIIGRSGAGKSTLIRLINLLERPTTGQVLINDKDITKLSTKELNKLRQKIGMVFQHFNLLSSKTILENVIFPLKIAGVEKETLEPRAIELLKLVGLEDHIHKYPSQLSGGQKQRVGIARALANQPEILLCDEATSALDPETTRSILDLLKDLSTKLNLTIVLITHSMDVIRAICDQVTVIEAGEIAEQGDVVEVFLHPQHPTTKKLLSESGVDTESWQIFKNDFKGHVFRLTYKGTDAAKPLLSRISLELGVEVNILQGTVGSIGSVQFGQLVVSTDCTKEQYEKLKEFLVQERVSFEELA